MLAKGRSEHARDGQPQHAPCKERSLTDSSLQVQITQGVVRERNEA